MSEAIQQQQSRAEHQDRRERTPAEWVTFGVASTILLTVIGLIVYNWLVTPAAPPMITVRPGEVRAAGDQFYVPFTIENSGGETAEAVQVIAELTIDGEVVENGEQQIDFLSGGETAEGSFVFSHDPREGELDIRVASFQVP